MCINQGFNYVCNKNGRLCTRCASYEEEEKEVESFDDGFNSGTQKKLNPIVIENKGRK